jgi:HSP20 family protein
MTRALISRDPLLDGFFGSLTPANRLWNEWFGQNGGDGSRVTKPAVDVCETESAVSISFDLPGLKKDDVSITVEDGVLTVSGEKKFEEETKERTWHRIERSYGRFHRALTLPVGVDADKAQARFEDGVLVVELPKTEAAKPKKIAVR